MSKKALAFPAAVPRERGKILLAVGRVRDAELGGVEPVLAAGAGLLISVEGPLHREVLKGGGGRRGTAQEQSGYVIQEPLARSQICEVRVGGGIVRHPLRAIPKYRALLVHYVVGGIDHIAATFGIDVNHRRARARQAGQRQK